MRAKVTGAAAAAGAVLVLALAPPTVTAWGALGLLALFLIGCGLGRR